MSKMIKISAEKLATVRDLLVQLKEEQEKTASEQGKPSEEVTKTAATIVDTMIDNGEMYAKDRDAAIEKLSSIDGSQAYFQHVLGLYREAKKEAKDNEKKASNRPKPVLGHAREGKTAGEGQDQVLTGAQKVAKAHEDFGDRVIALAAQK